MKESYIEMIPKILEDAKKVIEDLRKSIAVNNEFPKERLVIYPYDELPGLLQGLLTSEHKEEPKNQLIHGENLLTMICLSEGNKMKNISSMKGRFDLIYIDPPYNSKEKYYRTLKLYRPGDKEMYKIKQLAYSDSWNGGLKGYLEMITPRLLAIHELLSSEGSVYVHVDYRVVHYVKIIMDNIFDNNFNNEIIWPKDPPGKGAKAKSKQWPRTYDCILFYSKCKKWHFIKQTTPLTPEQEAEFDKIDSDNRRFKAVDVGDTSQSEMESKREKGMIYVCPSSGKEYIKKFLDESKNIIGDIWSDIKGFGTNSSSKERVFFQTQKPEDIIRRIIKASCKTGGLVGDFFAGSGTTALVAEELGCNWVINDCSKISCMTSLERLIEGKCKPFNYYTTNEIAMNYKSIEADVEVFIDNNSINNGSEIINVHLMQYEIIGADLNTINVEDISDINNAIVNKSISLVEYWDIDPDYNGNIFNSKWQSFIKAQVKQKVSNGINTFTRLTVMRKNDRRTIAIRTIDIFGNEYIFIQEK